MIVQDSQLDLDTPTGPMRAYVYTPTPPRGSTSGATCG